MKNLMAAIRRFRDERDWEQYHSPKNLAMSIAIEAAELMEHFQWIDGDKSLGHLIEYRDEIASELADVMIYCLNLFDRMDVDPENAIRQKLKLNGEKYPT